MAVEMTVSLPSDFCEPSARTFMNSKPERNWEVRGNPFGTHILLCPGIQFLHTDERGFKIK